MTRFTESEKGGERGSCNWKAISGDSSAKPLAFPFSEVYKDNIILKYNIIKLRARKIN